MHICNDKRLMTDIEENSTKVGRLIFDGILSDRRKIKIRLVLKDSIEGIVLTLTNVFYLPHDQSNLINLGFLNNIEIFYYNKD